MMMIAIRCRKEREESGFEGVGWRGDGEGAERSSEKVVGVVDPKRKEKILGKVKRRGSQFGWTWIYRFPAC